MNPLIASILNNPGKHQVNRAEKMSRSVDVHVSNIMKKNEQMANSDLNVRDEALERGYGQGRKMGD